MLQMQQQAVETLEGGTAESFRPFSPIRCCRSASASAIVLISLIQFFKASTPRTTPFMQGISSLLFFPFKKVAKRSRNGKDP
jgi:hypothetical protein